MIKSTNSVLFLNELKKHSNFIIVFKIKGGMCLIVMLYIGRTSSQKHLQTRRWVNNKTHSALSKAGPGCAMEEVEHTHKEGSHTLRRKIVLLSVVARVKILDGNSG